MSRTKLDSESIQQALSQLNAGAKAPWSLAEGKLHKQFSFGDFVQAFGFMTSAALVAESMNHHPEWCNVYNRVTVDLRTHDAGGITDLDFALARRLEALAH
jgi:4a-hydroxytetrahydrobiopterin dehydratase